MTKTHAQGARQQGFSLLEMLVVVAVLMLVMAVIFQQITLVQKRYRTEEAKLDLTQESREFVDQMVRDIHQAGFPNHRMYNDGVLMNPWAQDSRVAVGLVKFSSTDLWLEADVDGDGQVESVRYTLVAGAGGFCPCVLRRSQVLKINATAPMSQITSYSAGLEGVVNSGGAGAGGTNGSYLLTGSGVQTRYGSLAPPPIFTAFDADGNAVTATDFATDPDQLATIRTIAINVNVLVRAGAYDLQTGMRPALSLNASAMISNQ